MERRVEVSPGIFATARSVNTARGPVEYDLTENDKPVVLCSHGGIGGFDQARVVLNWLDDRSYRLLSPSRPGYLGTPLSSGATFEEQADLFAALLDSLEIDKVAVVTVSAGGPAGYLFAIRHPDRVWALIAIDSISGSYDMPETAGPITQAIFTSQLGQKILKLIGDLKPEIFLKQIFAAEAYFTKEQIKKHVEHALSCPEKIDFVRAFMTTMNPYNPRKPGTDNDILQSGMLKRLPVDLIRCPSLIIHGTHDADVKFYDGVYAYESIPSSERYWIEEGSHLGFWLNEKASEAQRAARDFIHRHSPGDDGGIKS